MTHRYGPTRKTYWDHRAEELKLQELAGETPRLNSGKARPRAEELQARLQKRLEELEQERTLSALPPVVVGGALAVPAGLLATLTSSRPPELQPAGADRVRIERLAMQAVMLAESELGFVPRYVNADKCWYEAESAIPGTGRLRFIEVKGRAVGARTVTVTKNKILAELNKPEDFILAVVEIDGNSAVPRCVRAPFQLELDFGVTSVNYDLEDLLVRAAPRLRSPCSVRVMLQAGWKVVG